jgi:hypothetical protein
MKHLNKLYINNLDELSNVMKPFNRFLDDIIYFSLEQRENKSGEYWVVVIILSERIFNLKGYSY